jgi:hypothetical protein
MPAWALGLQLGIALLTALQPEIEAAIAAAAAAGKDITPHTDAMTAVAEALGSFNKALAGGMPKP